MPQEANTVGLQLVRALSSDLPGLVKTVGAQAGSASGQP